VDELTRLLLRARDGDDAALADFVRAMHPPIRRYCVYLIGPDDADDAAQETFLAAWRALSSYRGDASARTWLFVIARRSADRVSRRRGRWIELAKGVPGPAPGPHPETANEPYVLLSGLEQDRRASLVLTQIIGLSYAEAAAVCECPIGTIRSRVARAREELLQQQFERRRENGSSTS
jgi:RNA polymerase sigma-70 factor, ECF subfamily